MWGIYIVSGDWDSALRSYSWGHSQWEMPYEHESCSEMVMEFWVECEGNLNNTKHEYRCIFSVTGHPTFQLTCDRVPECAELWHMLRWFAVLVSAVGRPHSARHARMGLHEKCGVWRQCKQTQGATSLNFQCGKMYECPWCSVSFKLPCISSMYISVTGGSDSCSYDFSDCEWRQE